MGLAGPLKIKASSGILACARCAWSSLLGRNGSTRHSFSGANTRCRSTSAARWRSRRATSGGEPRAACRTTRARLAISAVRLVVVFPISASRYLGTLYWVNPTNYAGRWNDVAWTWPRLVLSPNACLSLDDVVCAHRFVCALFAAEAGGRLRAARSCHCGACSPEPWTVVLVPCRASSPRTPNCRTGCRTILPWGTCSDPG